MIPCVPEDGAKKKDTGGVVQSERGHELIFFSMWREREVREELKRRMGKELIHSFRVLFRYREMVCMTVGGLVVMLIPNRIVCVVM